TGSVLTAGAGAVDTAGEIVLNSSVLTPDVNGIVIASAINNNGAGVVSLVKSGSGAAQLNANGTYSGGTYINSGRLRAQTASAYGTGPVYVAAGGGAYLGGANATYANNFFLSGKGF